MSDEIRITGEPVDDRTCRFVVDRPIYPEGTIRFATPDKALGSPLAEKILDIDGVTSLTVSGRTVTVTKDNPDPWPVIGKRIGAAIREALRSGVPPIAEGAKVVSEVDRGIREKVQTIIDRDINPAVASHGGFVELIDVEDAIVYVRLGGGCQGCGMANVTLKQGIEATIRQQVPEVVAILDTTEHALGTNPYYSPAKK
ncbi:MAG TPA: NifU family protein [Thermodesulfobacteriota bacterium]